jgi:phosphatidylglycerophosphate synthase
MSSRGLRNLLTVPNVLSLSRLPLGVAFWATVGPRADESRWAFVVLAAAALTDVLDGHLARRLAARPGSAGEQGGTGAWLDPICDKLFVGMVLAAIIVNRRPPVGVVLLIISRELVQLPLGLVYRFVPVLRSWLRYDFRASVLGKAATVAQFLAIAALILDHPSIWIFAAIAFLLGIAALVDYFRRAVATGKRRLAKERGEKKGRERGEEKGESGRTR